MTVVAWTCTAAALLLVVAYALGAPLVLVRALGGKARRRRLRFRDAQDDLLATSRFTIPVSIVVPVRIDDGDVSSAVGELLALRYPETEVIVVAESGAPALDLLRGTLDLQPCELFYRRSLPAPPVGAIYRSRREPRLIVATTASGPGNLRNCALNLARFRYVCVASPAARYEANGLLEGMHAALEDPARVVGVTTSLAVTPEGEAGEAPVRLDVRAALRHAVAARRRLASVARRRVSLPPDGPAGFSLWRRDAVVEAGGFAFDTDAVDAEMVFRLHRHYRADRRRYRILHVSDPVGTVSAAAAAAAAGAGRPTFDLVRRYSDVLLNPALGRIGLLDGPRFVFNVLLAPWVERLSLLLVVLGTLAGVLSPGQLLLVLLVTAFGNGVLVVAALLLDAERIAVLRPAALLTLVAVGPFEYFLRWMHPPGRPDALPS